MKKNSFIKLVLLLIICFLNVNILYADACDHATYILKPSGNTLNEYQQYLNALKSVGLNVKVISFSDLGQLNCSSENVLVIPGDAAEKLRANEINNILKLISRGLNLVTDKHTSLSEGLGLRFKRERFSISSISDINHPEIKIRWKNKAEAEKIDGNELTAYCREVTSNEPVMVGGKIGAGKYLFSSVSFDGEKSFGYGRFPYFHETFINHFNVKPFIKRNRLVAYLDLGYHESENLTELASRMKDNGINEVHISSWYSIERFGNLYKTLIQACHENGILVYMWLEFPMVTDEFWQKHPEWREKTALLNDAALDWRKLMAFENPECFDAVTAFLDELIKNYEWDGLDLAEFYFESLDGHELPSQFTPMSDFVRKDFKENYGFDPALIFNSQSSHYYKKNKSSIGKFLDYRIKLCTKLNRKLLTYLKSTGIDKALDIYLTQIANPFDKKLNKNIGVEVGNFIALQKEFGFTMQAEDPYPLWVLGPDRYKKIGNEYRKLLGSNAILTIDINIVEEGRDDPYPTATQTGMEFTELLNVASQNCDRVCIYAVNTPYDFDFRFAPYALASSINVVRKSSLEYLTESKKLFDMELDSSLSKVMVDGKVWNCFSGRTVIVPSGKHKIKVDFGKRDDIAGFLLKDISCEIKNCIQKGNDLELSYSENRNVYVTLNRCPSKIYANNKEISPKIYFNSAKGNYIVCCPGGSNSILFMDRK